MTDQSHSNLPALAEPRQQPSPPWEVRRTELEARLVEVKAATQTIETRNAMAELAACLTLVAPAGMSADDRAEWLKVAARSIGDVPVGAMVKACDFARLNVRRVSDLVPTIAEHCEMESKQLWKRMASLQWQIDNPPQPAFAPTVPREDKPFTADELLRLTPRLVRVAREQGWAEPETFAEYDRRREEQFGSGGE